MLCQQLANLFYEILVDFPRELTQLLADYVDILPVKYMFITNVASNDSLSFEVIPNKGLVTYGYRTICQKMDFKSNRIDIFDSYDTYCQINKKGDDFIIHTCDKLYKFNGATVSEQKTIPNMLRFVVDPLSDNIYTYSWRGVYKYSLIYDTVEKNLMMDNVSFIGKVRNGFIVQRWNDADTQTYTFMYDNDMKNPVEFVGVSFEHISCIIETSKHMYIIDEFGELMIDQIQYHTKLSNVISIVGIYQEHAVGILYDPNKKLEKLIIFNDNNLCDYQILYTCESSENRELREVKCFDNEIYVLASSSVFKLIEDIVV